MTEVKKACKRKSKGPFSEELLDELLSQLKGKDADSLLGSPPPILKRAGNWP